MVQCSINALHIFLDESVGGVDRLPEFRSLGRTSTSGTALHCNALICRTVGNLEEELGGNGDKV